jgi:hypothetical protein
MGRVHTALLLTALADDFHWFGAKTLSFLADHVVAEGRELLRHEHMQTGHVFNTHPTLTGSLRLLFIRPIW